VKKPRLAIAGLTACFGCQLSLLNCETELPEIADRFTFVYFPMGISSPDIEGEFDVAFVDGAVSTPGDLEMMIKLRNRSAILVAFGTCALWGGVAALKNEELRTELLATVYGAAATDIPSFCPSPVGRYIKTDFAITGCPPEKSEVLATLSALLHGTLPEFPPYPVCMECRSRENRCLLMDDSQLCLGPITQAGCNARCPAVSIKCEGCRGPVSEANVAAEMELLLSKGFSRHEIISRMRRFCPEWNYAQRS
jgi:coenzyme F420-reducing hydrogenase gamma subunit